MKLIIVESPTKAKTLSRFLGNKEYRVEATMGHIRDLPKATLGVDIEGDFAPSYIVPKDRQKHVTMLKSIAKDAEAIILATDPDREGEAIAWHTAEVLQNAKRKMQNLKRIVFHEITESAIKEAIDHPREIDLKLVDAQQARRVLDRLVGYKLSPLLWQKLSRRWLSAGRVQSVAVRLIVEREREIEKFSKKEFWIIDGRFMCHPGLDPGSSVRHMDSGSAAGMTTIQAQLVSKDSNKYEKTLTFDLFDGTYTTTSSAISSQSQADSIIKNLQAPFIVSAVDKKEIRRSPPSPYTTSTLQQDAGRRSGFSAKKTMQLAQKLYEEGIITYHRTDSVNLSEKFITEARDFIAITYGRNYIPDKARRYQTKSKLAQEAHEAIRPTDVSIQSSHFTEHSIEMNRDHIRIYDLVWKRAVASQAFEAIFDSTTIRITSSNGYLFEIQGSVIKFDGFLKILGREPNGEIELPQVTVGATLTLEKAIPTQHVTSPPPRYSEAALVKALEEKDIGRPSTYAPIISTIQDRMYVAKEDKKLVPTELGITVTDFLVRYFPKILELPFTAAMENEFDSIAAGQKAWQPVIRDFYTPFAADLDKTYESAERVSVPVEILEEKCPDCGNPLVVRTGRYGKFVACSMFPSCKYSRQLVEKIDKLCPRCGGDIVIKKSRRGKIFYGCGNYPTCTFAAWKKEDIK